MLPMHEIKVIHRGKVNINITVVSFFDSNMPSLRGGKGPFQDLEARKIESLRIHVRQPFVATTDTA
jgi:hypothetical protein